MASLGTDFSIPFSHELWILILARHLKYLIYIGKLEHDFQKTLNTLRCDMVGSTCGQRAAVRIYLSLGLVWVCEIEISHMGKNNGHPNLVCDNFLSHPHTHDGFLYCCLHTTGLGAINYLLSTHLSIKFILLINVKI